MPGGPRRVGDLLRPDPPGEGANTTLFDTVIACLRSHRAHSAPSALRRPAARLARRRSRRARPAGLLQPGEHDERLERRPRQPPDARVVQADAVLAAVVGEDAAGLRVDRDHRAAQVDRLPRQPGVGGVDGLPLPGRVDRRGDPQAGLAQRPAR